MENREGAQKRKRIFERTSQRGDFGSEFLPYAQRYPRRPSPRAWRAPQSSSASFSIIAESASMPTVKQNRSKLADTSSQALPTPPAFIGGKAVSVVLTLFMALLSFVESTPRAYRLKASNAAP